MLSSIGDRYLTQIHNSRSKIQTAWIRSNCKDVTQPINILEHGMVAKNPDLLNISSIFPVCFRFSATLYFDFYATPVM